LSTRTHAVEMSWALVTTRSVLMVSRYAAGDGDRQVTMNVFVLPAMMGAWRREEASK
jgi:hypothetical protein